MNISLSLTKSLHCLNLVILTFVNFVASVLILIFKQLIPSLPPLFTLRLITATPSTSISLMSQIRRLQLIQNYLVRVVVKAPKSRHISPVLISLHWLKINERIDYKLLCLRYKVLTTTQPFYLISLQPPRCTRTSSVVTLARRQASSSLKITNRSFQHASPHLWNKLFVSLRQPCLNQSSSPSSSSLSPLSSSNTPSLFHSKLKHIFSKNLFHRRHPYPSTGLIETDFWLFLFSFAQRFSF